MSEEPKPLAGVARNLMRLMRERQMSIPELSRLSEIPEARISELVAAEAEPTASELLRLAGSMDSRLSELLEGIAWDSDAQGGGSFRENLDGG